MYTPIIMIEERTICGEIKKCVFVTMPNGELYKIGDFDKIPDDNTINAIIYAYIRGVEAHRMAVSCVRVGAPYYKPEE